MVRVNISISEEVLKELDKQAQSLGVSRSEYVRILVLKNSRSFLLTTTEEKSDGRRKTERGDKS